MPRCSSLGGQTFRLPGRNLHQVVGKHGQHLPERRDWPAIPYQKMSFRPNWMSRELPDPSTGSVADTSGVTHPQPKIAVCEGSAKVPTPFPLMLVNGFAKLG